MSIPVFWVDAFTDRVFRGNPAAVCPLERWLDDGSMQAIAKEHGLSETAFFVEVDGAKDRFHIRWFTPEAEIDLCGHATLASAFVVFKHIGKARDRVIFASKSGDLTVTREEDLLALDFPSRPPGAVAGAVPRELLDGLGRAPKEILAGRDWFVVYESEEDVRSLAPDMALLKKLDRHGVIVTAPGREVDFVSRFFVPGMGIPEDPVTGSAHCALIPYWSKRLGKTELRAVQCSERSGRLECADRGERVKIAGNAVLFLEGHIHL